MKKILSVVMAFALISTLTVSAQARLVGDVNHDKTTNSADALLVLSYAVGTISEIDKVMADVNCDKNINSADALCILQISVGSYEGDLEVPDDILVTSFKKDKFDPIIQSGKFTISTTVQDSDKTVPTVISVNSNDLCAEMNYSAMSLRMLVTGGHCYLIFPTLKIYGETSSVPTLSFTTTAKETYVKSEYGTEDGKKCIREYYTYDDGSQRIYTFLENGELKKIETTDKNNKKTTQNITSLSSTVDESKFSLKGFIKVGDLDKYIK